MTDLGKGTAAHLSREITRKHAGDALENVIERDILAASIARVFTAAGAVNGDGNLHWEGDPAVTLHEDDDVEIDFGDVLVTISLAAAEKLVRSLVSALEVSRGKHVLSSGPVAGLLKEFMERFGGQQPPQ